jgi:hypothetical protein
MVRPGAASASASRWRLDRADQTNGDVSMTMKTIAAITAALLLGACAPELDRAPAGTADHSVYLTINSAPVPSVEGFAQEMDRQAAVAMAQKCGSTMRPVVMRRNQLNVNVLSVTFRCERIAP